MQRPSPGRTGGAVSLAVGMAQIFSGLPGHADLIDYWYHFAIMFEALFILTTIDAGTRVARFLLQEFLGASTSRSATDWLPGSDHLDTASSSSRGPTSSTPAPSRPSGRCSGSRTSSSRRWRWRSPRLLINMGRARYAWVTLLPLVFVATTTLTAGFLNIRDNFYPLAIGPDAALHFQGYLNWIVTVVTMVCVLVILASAIMRWIRVQDLGPVRADG